MYVSWSVIFAQVGKKVSGILPCGQQDQAVTVFLYSALVRLHLESCIQVWASHYKKNTEVLECVQREAVELGRVWSTNLVRRS